MYLFIHFLSQIFYTFYIACASELQQYNKIYLDMSLSCPGTTDYTCPHWDHTVQLYLCCSKTKPLCGKEIGRWITPFRRSVSPPNVCILIRHVREN